MSTELFEHFLRDESRRGPAGRQAFTGAAGGAACGDLSRVSLVIEDDRIADVSFDAEGCGATRAATAAVAEMVDGKPALLAARIGSAEVDDAIGGLTPAKLHAAQLAADALHRALAAAAASEERLAPPVEGRVAVAMSGGVDSAVAALLERERGADVVAITVKLWADQETDGAKACCSPEAVLGARAVAHSIDVPHITLDLEEDFRRRVVGSYLSGHAEGATPNPCIVCNGEVRLAAMADLAERLGAERLVTGHYARIVDEEEGPLLAAAADPKKDQSYMLAGLPPSMLPRLGFPLTDLTKPEVREIAARHGLSIARKPESQDLCFLAGQGQRRFLRRHGDLYDREGTVVDRTGKALGRHRGHHNFTVGQRRGIRCLGAGGALRHREGRGGEHDHGRHPRRARRDAGPDPRRGPPSRRIPGRLGAPALPLRRGTGRRRGTRRHTHQPRGRAGGLIRRSGARPNGRPSAKRRGRRPRHYRLEARNRLPAMKAQEIRDTYLSFFEERGHRVVPSASLVPSVHDPSVLLTTAGMQPFKPYFLGREEPPAPRLTDVQKCFRTTDIEEVGNTARHLTFFEMLGNWSFGDYFKAESIPWGWELSTEGFGMDPERIWVTVFGGDEELGLGPDEEAIEIWRSVGVPQERIVLLGRVDNFWQAGPTGPCGPCSELYLDRGEDFGAPDDRPGDDTDRFLEFWNHVFMTYDLAEGAEVSELPMRNIDTGMGLDRMAAVLQDVPSVFETDLIRPLIDLAEELSGRAYSEGGGITRAMRIVADHSRGASFLIADGVVPSNEDRGYILRRIMRRAIQQGRTLGLEAPWLGRFAERTIEVMSGAYPELEAERETIARWVGDEEESFGRTLERGTELLEQLVDSAQAQGTSWIDAGDAFKLHDTYGFPFDLTKELLAERGLAVDDSGFEELMEEQRARARTGAATAHGSEDRHERVIAFATETAATRFVGYETLRATTGVAAVASENGKALVKLEESPFYAEGGGQVADSGVLRWRGGEAEVVDVYRVGQDQVLEVSAAGPLAGAQEAGVEAVVDHESRHATMRNHTATHLLHAALRERLGDHVRQAGSAVRPDKLRFDFTHGKALESEDIAAIEDRVNGWIKASRPVRWLEMERPEAERLGAMALFGEKYGDWVRVVEVDGVSRELCGGTHVANTAEIGIFKIASEGSSAANVRRIEALSGPAAIDWFREREERLREVGELLGAPQDPLAGARRAAERLREAGEGAKQAARQQLGEEAERLAGEASEIDGLAVVAGRASIADQKQLLDLASRIQGRLSGESAVVLGGAEGERVALVALVSKPAVARGVSAADVVGEAAPVIGGGGGGREGMAQAGGREPARLDDALGAARAAIERALS